MKYSILSKRSINRTEDHSSLRLRSGSTLSRSPFAPPMNAHNAAIALPAEILHTIFVFCAGLGDPDGPDTVDPNPLSVTRRPRYAPNWIAITYVCQRWRAVALNFKKLWSTITPNLSPKWIAEFLQRSALVPKHVNIDVGPPSPPPVSSSKKPHKRRRFGMSTSTTTKKKRRSVRKPPLMALPSEAVEEVFSHASRIEDLHLEGNTVDVIRTLTSLGDSMPLLSCLSLGTWDESNYPHFDSGDDDEREDPSLVLSETLFGTSAPRLHRLHFRSGLHLTFPSWLFRALTEFSISCSFCVKRLFSALGQMPQLEVLRVSPVRRYWFLPHSDGVTMPVTLKHLSVLVIENTFLELLIALLGCISVPPTVRRHLKLKLDGSKSDAFLWGRFSSMMPEIIANSPDPIHGIHFRREPSNTSVRLWVSPASSLATGHRDINIPLSSSSWPPLDDPFSLEIHCVDRNCLYGLHTSYSVSFFHRLQELCVSLGGPSVQELFVEYGTEPNSRRRPSIPHRCWRTLFAGLTSLKTLRFGDGAAELLVGTLYGGAAAVVPTNSAAATITTTPADSGNVATGTGTAWRGFLSGSLQRVIVSRSAFSTRILWDWIHYAYARPAEWDASLLRMNVLADLSVPRWRPADIEPVEDVTESLLIFLLHCRSMGAQVSELSLVESTWDNSEPGGLEILGRLLHILDPDWNVILETISSPD
ncbi:hypothetical protein F5888DRAFT_674518 [Russula emetica]|nr:hypothetical protein F5888DRAFT_674518 [Russula emetica]